MKLRIAGIFCILIVLISASCGKSESDAEYIERIVGIKLPEGAKILYARRDLEYCLAYVIELISGSEESLLAQSGVFPITSEEYDILKLVRFGFLDEAIELEKENITHFKVGDTVTIKHELLYDDVKQHVYVLILFQDYAGDNP